MGSAVGIKRRGRRIISYGPAWHVRGYVRQSAAIGVCRYAMVAL